ncbi:MAG: class I SAM-dependent methyltransferase [Gammaproteobacteria bacterium]|nr:class I SAM-dependent methyltransferase [Gammaproteobacteria bacterium]
MLLEQSALHDLLRCPRTRNRLVQSENGGDEFLECDEEKYRVLNGVPILVNYDKSILDEHDTQAATTVVPRYKYGKFISIFKSLINLNNSKNRKNINNILHLLAQKEIPPRVLIIGGATIGQGMGPFYSQPGIELVSFDIYPSAVVQFVADTHNIPLASESFDLVVIQAVLEHVLDPAIVVGEIHRLLKKDGLVYAETPFLQHVHEGAYDFTRFTESGHRYLFKKFHLMQSGVTSGAGTQLLWAVENFFRGVLRSRIAGKLVKVCFFWLQYFDFLIPESYNIDAACGVYFFGRKSTDTLSYEEILSHYSGAQ